jgi:hypothetical protein
MRTRSQLHPIRKEECEDLAETLDVEIEEKRPESGELYIAGRNTEPKLLTAKRIEMGCVFPEESEYPYDTGECFRLKDEYQ